jgi:cytochrome d ubiquinol oxidase subunit I
LNEFRPQDRPPVAVPFLCYHLMIGLGTAFIALTLLALFFWWRGTLFDKRWLLWVFVFAVLGPYLANQAGWVATEVGRQPFIVYPSPVSLTDRDADGKVRMEGGLRTVDGLSNREVVDAGQVLGSIVMFSLVYLLLFAVWVYVLNSKIQHGPDEEPAVPQTTTPGSLYEAAARLQEHTGYSLTKTEE